MNTSAATAPYPRAFLDSFYKGHGISDDNSRGKIEKLRQYLIRDEVFVASSEGVMDDKRELAALENYVLATLDFKIDAND